VILKEPVIRDHVTVMFDRVTDLLLLFLYCPL